MLTEMRSVPQTPLVPTPVPIRVGLAILAALGTGVGLDTAFGVEITLIIVLFLAAAVFLVLWLSAQRQRHSETDGRVDGHHHAPYPPSLATAVSRVGDADVFNEAVEYNIELRPTNGRVEFHNRARMSVFNRSDHRSTYYDIFDPAGTDNRFLSATVDGSPLDPDDPANRTGLGFQVKRELDSGQRLTVEVNLMTMFEKRDSELIGSYLPCARFLIVLKAPPTGFRVNFQELVTGPIQMNYEPSGDRRVEYLGGVLPFQGVRMSWEPE